MFLEYDFEYELMCSVERKLEPLEGCNVNSRKLKPEGLDLKD
jgi:hypothetical protein